MAIQGRAVAPAALCAVLAAPSPVASAAERPNVLWLVGEDLGPQLGSDGTREVTTPRLDRLAAEGARYTRFFTTAPVCSASRSAFMTGMYQTTIGAHHHRSHRDDGYTLPPGVRVLTDLMRDAGYYTANVVRFPEGVGLAGTGKTDWNFTYRGRPFDSDRWEDIKGHEPFFAQVNFSETHRANVERQGTPWPYPRRADPDRVVLPPYYPDHPVTRRDWAGYLDSVSSLDEKVGKVLDLLEKDGLASRTVVVFFGDNGQAHVRGKQFCYDSGLHVPMIVRLPRALAAGSPRCARRPGAAPRLRRPGPVRRDGLPIPHRARRALPVHPELHAGPTVPPVEPLQGRELPGVEPDQGAPPRGPALGRPGATRGADDARRGALRHGGRPPRDREPRLLRPSCPPGGPSSPAGRARGVDRGDRRQGTRARAPRGGGGEGVDPPGQQPERVGRPPAGKDGTMKARCRSATEATLGVGAGTGRAVASPPHPGVGGPPS